MKALSKENTPFVNEVAPADQNNNVLDENNKGSNKEVNLHDSLEKKTMTFFFIIQWENIRDSGRVRLALLTCN